MLQRFTWLAWVAILATGSSSPAQFSSNGLVSSSAAQRFGLTRAWHTQIQLDRARGRISDLTQHVSSTQVQTYYEVVSDRSKFEFSEHMLGRLGQPIGPLGAIEKAAETIVALVDEMKARKTAGIDLDALALTQQAAEQVLENVKNALLAQATAASEAREGATGEGTEGSAATGIVNLDAVIAPLLRRATAVPDLLPKLVRHVVPQITLYVSTDQGVVHAIDGETGRTRWIMPVGRPNHPTMAPAANDKYLAFINGSKIYVVYADTGKLAWQKWLKNIPGAPPAMTDERIFVPMVNGRVEVYRITRNPDEFQMPISVVSAGRGLIRPTATSVSVGWPTDKGYFYVSDLFELRPRFRLEANRTIVAPASYLPPRFFFVASIDGYVYCVHETRGDILWRFSTGEGISHMPIAIGKAVYVVTDNGGMYRVNVDNGQDEWWTPNVKRFLAASAHRLYCADDLGQILIIDAETGGRTASIPTEGLNLKFINWQTDRLFLGTSAGLIQCLHETDLVQPLVHAGVEGPSQPQQDAAATEESSPMPKEAPKSDDPFGGSEKTDPFVPFGGKKADPFGPDPFGGSSEPFGTGSGLDTKKNTDPFGNSSSPFG